MAHPGSRPAWVSCPAYPPSAPPPSAAGFRAWGEPLRLSLSKRSWSLAPGEARSCPRARPRGPWEGGSPRTGRLRACVLGSGAGDSAGGALWTSDAERAAGCGDCAGRTLSPGCGRPRGAGGRSSAAAPVTRERGPAPSRYAAPAGMEDTGERRQVAGQVPAGEGRVRGVGGVPGSKGAGPAAGTQERGLGCARCGVRGPRYSPPSWWGRGARAGALWGKGRGQLQAGGVRGPRRGAQAGVPRGQGGGAISGVRTQAWAQAGAWAAGIQAAGGARQGSRHGQTWGDPELGPFGSKL